MFRSLRWRLTLFFVLSAGVIYVALAIVGGLILQQGIDNSLNEELEEMALEIDDIIDMSNLEPELTRWRHGNPNRAFMPTVEIFSKQHVLLGASGPIRNVPFLGPNNDDKIADMRLGVNHLRVLSHPIEEKSEAGWMQLAIPLRQRDIAISTYYNTCAFMSPLLLFALAITGFLFAKRATRPVEESFAILRNFVADAGHELNTPITIMQANVEALQGNFSTLEETLPVIMRTCERMANLVRDLLLLAQLESPAEQSKIKTDIDLHSMTRALHEEFIRLYEAKNIALNCNSQLGLVVEGDYDEIHRAVTNLLKNALNYTDSGSVSLNVRRAGSHAEISVTDTGKGIPADSIDQIFNRFYRVDRHRARSAGGSGLGLAIVRAIIENHGGSIHVKSVLGEGSTFSIELPLAAQKST